MDISRRRFLAGAGAGLAWWPLSRWAWGLESRPNVVFISIDDLNDWVSVLDGYPGVRTPNLERLARRGVTFARAYCSAPACNPSRVSVLAGLRPSTSEIYTNHEKLRAYLPDAMTLPQAFRMAGYRVAGGGKVFHGAYPYGRLRAAGKSPGELPWDAYDHDPALWDEYFTFPPDPVPAGLPLNGMDKPVFDWGPGGVPEQATPDARLADWAAQRLARPQPRPLFLAVGFFRPHLPWYVPRRYFDLYPLESVVLPPARADDLEDVPPVGRAWAGNQNDHRDVLRHDQWRAAVQGYLASISYVDQQLGRVLDALEQGPNAGNTVVVLWSDHGFHLGEKLHWRKFTLWERATRVPLIVAAPGLARAGARCERTVSLLDLYPTLQELCGLTANPALEGRSLVSLLADPQRSWEWPALSTWGAGNHAVRSERWRYIRYRDGTEELYDQRADPNEWTNLAARPESAAVKTELARWIEPLLETEQSLGREFDILLRKIRGKLSL